MEPKTKIDYADISQQQFIQHTETRVTLEFH
jgi:hypothetical protein